MRKKYPSDIKREQFEVIRPVLESARRKTAPRRIDLYEVFCAVLYLLRTGCPWRYLPRGGQFPPRSTVYNIFRGLQRDGVWEAIAATLVEAERQRHGREPDPTASILDSQTARAAERGGLARTRWATMPANGPRGASVTC